MAGCRRSPLPAVRTKQRKKNRIYLLKIDKVLYYVTINIYYLYIPSDFKNKRINLLSQKLYQEDNNNNVNYLHCFEVISNRNLLIRYSYNLY